MSLAAPLLAAVLVALLAVLSRRARSVPAHEIGPYLLEARIGGGGMGEVWRARHKLLGHIAAVKLARRGDRRRFEREARATAALTSPHVVRLHDFGAAHDGTPYYAMELVDGLDLDTLVQQHGPLPAGRAVHILRQVCAALAEAHARGLVHRDIKPANIVLGRAGQSFDFAKLLDFGLVVGGDDARTTADGTCSGTPAFMAPEVAVDEPSDGRADLYALGCVAYWLVTGKLVFEGAASRILIDHVRTPPVPPSRRVELPIPEALEALILACLEKDPARRPPSAEAVAARLERCVPADAWSEARARSWWAAHAPPASRAPSPASNAAPTPSWAVAAR
jgi:serine/threonine-protein kinase